MLGCSVLGTMSKVDAPSPPLPSPPPPPVPSGYVSAFDTTYSGSDSCPLSFYDGMSCFDSPNYPNTFSSSGNSVFCHLNLGDVAKMLHVVAFDLPAHTSGLFISDGQAYVDWALHDEGMTNYGDMLLGPSGVVVSDGGSVSFDGFSDWWDSEAHSGFRICAGASPGI